LGLRGEEGGILKELSLHILDIVQNSLVAEATKIEVSIELNEEVDLLSIKITDNGKGMDPEMLARVTDPYATSRTTRRVGMGIPLLKDACQLTGGTLEISSVLNKGTTLKATLGYRHIDRQPLGDMAGVIALLVTANPLVDFIYTHSINGNKFILNTQEVKEVLEGIPLNSPEVFKLLKEMVSLNLDELQIT
jgi:hypothetical protein